MNDILGFFKEYRFLSNFHVCEFMWNGIAWTSAEHAYQAAKMGDRDKMLKFSKLSTPKDAKIAGGLITMREDWDDVKYGIMLDIVRAKFNQNPDLQHLLLSTGNAYLEETNTWRDTTWGVCEGRGLNWLGQILMKVREELMRRDAVKDLINQTMEF